MNTPPAPTDANWQPPSLQELAALLPQYEFLELIGVGGMGAVYKARQMALDRLVAVKILPPVSDDGDIDYAERFKIEARTLARLSHTSIVAVYDFGQTAAGQLYFVMEYVDGTDVAQMLLRSGRLPQAHALAIIAHVCDALACAHAQQVIHRDIKPANILIAKNGQVKVADFGLASLGGQQDRSVKGDGVVLGTPDFVAPETLILGAPVDGRADLFAVGVMLYNMLTGKLPNQAGLPASALVPGEVDPRLDVIIRRAMETDPELRPASAQELRAELDRVVFTPQAVQAAHSELSSTEPEPPGAKQAQRLPLALLAAAAALALLGWFLWPAGQGQPTPEQPPSPVAVTAPALPETPKMPATPAAAAEPEHRPDAPLGDVRHEDGQRYRFVPGRYDRTAAVAKAAALGARLARVDTHDKVEWLWEKLIIPSLYLGQRVWVDGVATEAGDWRWSDGSPVRGDLPWASQQPDAKAFPAFVDLHRDDDNPGLSDVQENDDVWRSESVGLLIEFPAKEEPAMATVAPPAPAPAPQQDAAPAPPPAMEKSSAEAPTPAPTAPTMPPPAPREPTAAERRLAQLDASFRAAYQRDAGQTFEAAMKNLTQGYLGALSRARVAAQSRGSLDEVTALDAEKASLEAGDTPPPADLQGTPPSLVSLRQTWRATQAKHLAERDRRVLPLYQKYIEALTAYEAELTRANQIDDAKTVRDAREKIAAEMPSPEALAEASASAGITPRKSSDTAVTTSAVPVSAGGSWRQLALWVIGLGGSVEVVGRDGISIQADNAKSLPSGRFDITGIYLPDGKATQATDKDFTLLVTARSLRQLYLTGPSLTSLEPLRGLPQLTSVTLVDCAALEDAKLAVLGSLPLLRELSLYRCPVGTACLSAVAACPKLAELRIHECTVTDDALAALASARSLQSLSLNDVPNLTDAGISRLAEGSRVRQLAVYGQHFTGEGWDRFGQQAQLSVLMLANCRPSAEGLRALSSIASLRQVTLDSCALTDELLLPFAATSRLEGLSLEDNPLTGPGLKHLAGNTALRLLDVSGDDTALSDEALTIIASQWPQLTQLRLGKGTWSATGLTALSSLRQLVSLSLDSSSADDRFAAELTSMNRLKTLELKNWSITPAGLESLKSLKALTRLELEACATLDDSAIPLLRDFKRLSELVVRACGLTEDGLAQLRKGLPASVSLTN